MANGGSSQTSPAAEQGSEPGPDSRDLAHHPILQTVLFLALGWLAFVLLGLEAGDGDVVERYEWVTWKATAAAGLALAVVLLLHGGRRLVASYSAGDAGLYAGSVVMACVLVAAVWFGVDSMINSEREWAVPSMEHRLDAVVLVGTGCTIPWVAAVWIAYQRVERAGTTASLMAAWDDVIAIAEAFALFVVIAVLPTGALLNLWLAHATTDAQLKDRREVFDAEHVALYGALYGVIVVAIMLPLIVAWRAKARRVVDSWHPPGDQKITATWQDDRAAHEKLLGLDVSLIRNPLTALTVLTPLLTSVVATYLPSVGGKT